ncbi:MAG: hypothetical protein ACFCAD_16715 [Pleurocapsa sp.]
MSISIFRDQDTIREFEDIDLGIGIGDDFAADNEIDIFIPEFMREDFPAFSLGEEI